MELRVVQKTSVVCANKGVAHIVNDGSPFKLEKDQ